ncbi:LysR substrate-binding domain-containing protein [Entomohabitans teleogrylli]|uniref:LysR substrate-binding domain-containing protein n=1 Tax=Entomohabitans teleogrylli TaxID=1384589 RepID=UPI00073D4B93|nr:LysR substrate-binding domain-containing protein [Entomohabitans teleogrylli]
MVITAQALNVVITTARCGSFSAAAEELHKVPTALSYTVHKLESDLGLKLFTRNGKQLELTEAGRYFIKKGELILAELDDLQHSALRISAGVETTLQLSLNNIVSLRPVYTLLRESERLFPQTEIHLAIDVHDGVWDALLEKRADIAIGAPSQIAPHTEIRSEKFATVEWLFAISPNHPLTHINRTLRADDVRHYPAICIRDTSIRLEPKIAWQLRGQKAVVAPDYHSKIAMHLDGLGVGFLPRHICQPYLAQGRLVTRNVEESKQPTSLYLAWREEPVRPCFSWWLEQLRQPDVQRQFLQPLE